MVEAADVIDAAIADGNYISAIPAAVGIVKSEFADSALRNAAEQILGQVPDRPVSLLSSEDEWDDSAITRAIARLKRRLASP